MKLAFALVLAGTSVSAPLSRPAAEAPLLQPAAPDAAALAPVAEFSKSPASPSSSETAGEWSEIVDHMRGRLVADTGMDVSGATEVGIFIELENLELGSFSRRIVIFARDRSLQWTMTDARGKAVPGWGGDVPWTIDYFYVNESVSVPAGGRRRFPICSGNYHTLHEGFLEPALPRSSFSKAPAFPSGIWWRVATNPICFAPPSKAWREVGRILICTGAVRSRFLRSRFSRSRKPRSTYSRLDGERPWKIGTVPCHRL